MSAFAATNGFQISHIEQMTPDNTESLSKLIADTQEKLGHMIAPDFNKDWVTQSGYFEAIHLESVLTKSQKECDLSLLEISATFDHLPEKPEIQRQYRFDDWEGNVLFIRFPDATFPTTRVSIGHWRLFYHADRVLLIRYDHLKLKALWPIKNLEVIIAEAISLAEKNRPELASTKFDI